MKYSFKWNGEDVQFNHLGDLNADQITALETGNITATDEGGEEVQFDELPGEEEEGEQD